MARRIKLLSVDTIDGIPVYCSHTELVDISTLKPHPKNPNKHPKSQIKLLAKIIKGNGWRSPITVSKRSGYVIRGHGRLEAAIYANLKQAPVDYQDYNSLSEERADLVADNTVPELSVMDSDLLRDIVTDLNDVNFDVSLTGISESTIASLMKGDIADYSDLDAQLESLDGLEDANISITVPAKYKDKVIDWLADGNSKTSAGLGRGVLKKCGLL